MPYVVLLGTAIVDHAVYVPGGPAVINLCALIATLEYDVSLWNISGLMLQLLQRGQSAS